MLECGGVATIEFGILFLRCVEMLVMLPRLGFLKEPVFSLEVGNWRVRFEGRPLA